MNTKSKIVMSVSIVLMVLALATIAIVAIWAATRQQFTSAINVRYTSMQVYGNASARWKVGNGDWKNMTTTGKPDGATQVTFGVNSNASAALSPTDEYIDLTDANPYVVFEYKFINKGGNEYAIDLFYTDDKTADTNISVHCLSSDTQITSNFEEEINTDFGNWTTTTIAANNGSKDGEKYIYVIAEIQNIYFNASYSGSFSFDLDGQNYENYFDFSNGTITGLKSDFTGSALRIPSQIGGIAVTTIAAGAFTDKANITEVIIPDSVQTIEQGAFNSGCSKLKYISIPFVGNTKTGTSNAYFGYIFGASSFSSQNSSLPITLTNVIITGGTSIISKAFYKCNILATITIPSSVKSIEGLVFANCSGLTSMTIPGSVESIGGNAFNGCGGLKEVIIESQTVCSNLATWNSSSNTYLTYYATTVYAKYEITGGLSGFTKSDTQQGGYWIYTKD